MLTSRLKLALPAWFVWVVLFLTLLPDLVNLAGFNFGDIDFVWKSFIHTVVEVMCVATAFLIVFLSIIDFKIKGDVSTPLVAFTMLCSGVLDMVHVLASNNLIFHGNRLTFISIYTWSLSRTFNALMLLLGASLFLVQSDNLFKNVKKHTQKFLIYITVGFTIITVAYIALVVKLNPEEEKAITPFVLGRNIDIIPLIMYLFALTIIFPKFYTNHPSAFSQTLLLSLIPSIFAQLHLVSGFTLPYDNAAMIAYYDKLISYLVPFAGIGMNYLQTHINEIEALNLVKAESEQKNVVQEALRKREALLSQAEEVGQLGSWEWDLKTGKVVWSDQLIKLYGHSPDETEHTIEDGFNASHPGDQQKLRDALDFAIKEKSSFSVEVRRVIKDGSTKNILSKGKVFTDESGEPSRVLAVNLDITNIRLLSNRLKHNEMLYQAFASNMPDTEVLLFNEEGKITLAEGNITDSILSDKKLLVGKPISEVFSLLKLDLKPSSILHTNPANQVQLMHEYNGKYFKIFTRAISFNEGEVINGMILIQDITEIRKAGIDLELKIAELDRSNSELENFAYVASHDLQEPLRKITSFGDRLKGKFTEQLPAEGLDYLGRMISATARMQLLISDLLAFSRITRPEESFQTVNLNTVIKNILSDVEIGTLEVKADITSESLPEIEAIPSQIHQLLQNIILNSVKFRKPDIAPVIIIRSEKIDGTAAGFENKNIYYKISIEDNGIGFEEKYAERIFALFQRLHGRNEYEGTGIGLALCKKIVEFHHGKIWATGTENIGAIFNIVLPAKQHSTLNDI